MKPRPRTSATSGIRADAAEQLAEQADLRLQAHQRPLLLEGVEAGERGRAGERVAGVGVAVEEGALLLGGAEEALVDALRGQRRRQRHVAAGQPLGEAEQVGRDPLLLAGEHRPGAAEAGRHLVADQQHAVPVAELAHRAQVAGRVDVIMPAAPWTSGSTITAAISSSCGARIRARSAASPGSAAWESKSSGR